MEMRPFSPASVPQGRPYLLQTARTLIIPDVHLDLPWLESLVEQERGEWDQCVFLGDYFDSYKRPAERATSGEIARWLVDFKAANPRQVHLLIGNHDVPYLEAIPGIWAGRSYVKLNHFCPGFSSDEAIAVSKVWDTAFMDHMRLFFMVNGHLISHAGLHPHFWRANHPGVDDPLEALEAHCQIALERMSDTRIPFLSAGPGRFGPERFGGITWLDWNSEFQDDPELPPQIVGHTPDKIGIRFKGRSACLDGGQTCWGILHEKGETEARYPRRR